MEHEPDTLNWYKISLMRIADDIGTPRAESVSEWQKTIRSVTGMYIRKEAAIQVDRIIKTTLPNSDARSEAISSFLQRMGIGYDHVKIISSLAGPYA